jgi:hypothetical protein
MSLHLSFLFNPFKLRQLLHLLLEEVQTYHPFDLLLQQEAPDQQSLQLMIFGDGQ